MNNFICFEINEEYKTIADKRIEAFLNQERMF